jgi:fructokinase
MPAKRHIVVGLGEVLWDLLPKGKELGGAPANFAYMTSLLGDKGVVASRVGRDRLGNAAARRLLRLGLKTAYIQVDAKRQTGTVKVQVESDGQPQFEITENVAWDFFEWTPLWQALAEQTDAVCFGSLAQRSSQSRGTIRTFLQTLRPSTLRVFDVNLRQAFYSVETLAESAKQSDIMKLNQDELPKVLQILGGPDAEGEQAAAWLLKTCGLKLVCLTQGPRGSLLVSPKEAHQHRGFKTVVADTVGAGDAFTAALVHHYLRGANLEEMNEAANRMGSWVASQVGATPRAEVKVLESIRGVKG